MSKDVSAKKVAIIDAYALPELTVERCGVQVKDIADNEVAFVKQKIVEEEEAGEIYLKARLVWGKAIKEGAGICKVANDYNKR
jgi:hypothetical protein